MIKLFYSGTYKVRHEMINEENVLEMLKDDIRSKIVGNVKDTVYASDGVIIEKNKNVKVWQRTVEKMLYEIACKQKKKNKKCNFTLEVFNLITLIKKNKVKNIIKTLKIYIPISLKLFWIK